MPLATYAIKKDIHRETTDIEIQFSLTELSCKKCRFKYPFILISKIRLSILIRLQNKSRSYDLEQPAYEKE